MLMLNPPTLPYATRFVGGLCGPPWSTRGGGGGFSRGGPLGGWQGRAGGTQVAHPPPGSSPTCSVALAGPGVGQPVPAQSQSVALDHGPSNAPIEVPIKRGIRPPGDAQSSSISPDCPAALTALCCSGPSSCALVPKTERTLGHVPSGRSTDWLCASVQGLGGGGGRGPPFLCLAHLTCRWVSLAVDGEPDQCAQRCRGRGNPNTRCATTWYPPPPPPPMSFPGGGGGYHRGTANAATCCEDQ